uniref:acidic leucine-rich nuclear phosphoprotein 32 family member B-like n=1 Tax=Solea senegalensis TaxID=28829 RepID=UPI001CD912AC|nr:acidic leucine-rich nuclear phosphoprotein 32 family member B-like [Solea senegalensis]
MEFRSVDRLGRRLWRLTIHHQECERDFFQSLSLQLVSSPDMSSEGSDVDCYVRDPDYDPKYYESTPSDVVENVDTDFDTDEPKSTSTILAEEDQGGDQDDDPDFNKEEDQKEGQEEDQDDGYEEDQDEDQEEDQKDDQDDDWEEGQDDDQEEAHEEDQDGDHEEDQDDDHEEDQDDDDQEEDPLKGESPTPTQSHVTSPIETDEEDEDKGRDLCSPAPCSEDDDENLSFSQKPSQKKRKKSVKARDKSSNLISKKRHAPCPEDDDDDDDQGPELFHPRKRPTPCSGLGLDGHTDNCKLWEFVCFIL